MALNSMLIIPMGVHGRWRLNLVLRTLLFVCRIIITLVMLLLKTLLRIAYDCYLLHFRSNLLFYMLST